MNFNLVGFTKNKSTDLFVGILKIENFKSLYNNYVKGDKHNVEEGLFTFQLINQIPFYRETNY